MQKTICENKKKGEKEEVDGGWAKMIRLAENFSLFFFAIVKLFFIMSGGKKIFSHFRLLPECENEQWKLSSE